MNKEPENLLLAIEVENAFSVRDTVRIDFRATNIKTNQAKMLSDNIFVWNKQKMPFWKPCVPVLTDGASTGVTTTCATI